jgi:hypothetical protein
MFALAVIAQVKMDKIDEATSIFRDSVIPTYKQMQGFKNATLMIDPATGKSLGISYWETKADGLAIQTNGTLQAQLDKLSVMLEIPGVPNFYEVKV